MRLRAVNHCHAGGGTIELINRLAKSYLGWKGHRLRHAPGLDILGQFVFAGLTFVSWLADTAWSDSDPEAGKAPGVALLTQMASTPADVLADEGGVVIQFRPNSGWPNRSLRKGIPNNEQRPVQKSKPDLVLRKPHLALLGHHHPRKRLFPY